MSEGKPALQASTTHGAPPPTPCPPHAQHPLWKHQAPTSPRSAGPAPAGSRLAGQHGAAADGLQATAGSSGGGGLGVVGTRGRRRRRPAAAEAPETSASQRTRHNARPSSTPHVSNWWTGGQTNKRANEPKAAASSSSMRARHSPAKGTALLLRDETGAKLLQRGCSAAAAATALAILGLSVWLAAGAGSRRCRGIILLSSVGKGRSRISQCLAPPHHLSAAHPLRARSPARPPARPRRRRMQRSCC